MDYKIEQISDMYPIYYSGIIQGIYSSESRIDMPIVLESGESKAFLIKIGALIDKKAYSILNEKYKNNTPIKYQDIIDYLALNEIDIYGNKVKPTVSDGVLYGFSKDSEGRYPTYNLTFSTARKFKFSKTFNDMSIGQESF
jgi:hypothetical protein